jgi:inorganic phosphate transporter, PiT family
MERFKSASLEEKGNMLRQLKKHREKAELTKKERKGLKKVYRHELVKRSALLKIVAAWVITVPASAFMAAMLYFTIRGMALP